MKHWRSMTQNPYLQEVFPEPPLTAYKGKKNLKVPKEKDNKPKRYVKGMKSADSSACPYIMEIKIFIQTNGNGT